MPVTGVPATAVDPVASLVSALTDATSALTTATQTVANNDFALTSAVQAVTPSTLAVHPAPGTRVLSPPSSDLGAFSLVSQLGSEQYVYTFEPLGNGRILAGTQPLGAIYASDDSGVTWYRIAKNVGGASTVHHICYVGNGVVLAGTDNAGKIARSTDFGNTWTTSGTSPQVGGGSIHQSTFFANLGGGVVLAGTFNSSPAGGYIFKSTDYGATWDSGQLLGAEISVNVLIPCENGIVLAGCEQETAVNWFRSTDSGATWTRVSSTAINVGEYGHSGTYIGNGVVVASGYGGSSATSIYRSTDYGATWTKVYTTSGVQGVFWVENCGNGVMFAGTGIHNPPNVYQSTDYGVTWSVYQNSWNGGADTTSTHVLCLRHVGGGAVLAGMGTSGYVYRTGLNVQSATQRLRVAGPVPGYVGPPTPAVYNASGNPGNHVIVGRRFTVPCDGTLHDTSIYIVTSSGNVRMMVYDTGDTTTSKKTLLWDSGSVAVGTGNAWQTVGDPALAVKRGQQIDLCFEFDNATATTLRVAYQGGAVSKLPTSFWPADGGNAPRITWTNDPGSFTAPSTIDDTNVAAGAAPHDWLLIARVS